MSFYHSQNSSGKYSWILVNSDTHSWLDAGNSGAQLQAQGAVIVDSFQKALNSLLDYGKIWVIQGIHKPTEINNALGNTPRDRSFNLTGLYKCSIFGGFKGDETTETINTIGGRQASYSFTTRYTFDYPSILSGDHDGTDANKSYHTVYNERLNAFNNLVLDGFTISGGNADGSGDNSYGGGVYDTTALGGNVWVGVLLHNCKLSDNKAAYGGGYYANKQTRKTFGAFEKTLITANHATNYGGGVYCLSYIQFSECSFIENTADVNYSTMYATSYIGSGQVDRCYIKDSSTSVSTNASIQGLVSEGSLFDTNKVHTGSVIYTTSSFFYGGLECSQVSNSTRTCYLHNSVVLGEFNWRGGFATGDKTVSNSYVGNLTQAGISVDVVNPITDISINDFEANTYVPKPWSNVINAGDNSLVVSTEDILGNPRIHQSIVDAGCYELQEDVFAVNFYTYDHDGATGVADVEVTVEDDAGGGMADVTRTTDSNGEVLINLPAGEYWVVATGTTYVSSAYVVVTDSEKDVEMINEF